MTESESHNSIYSKVDNKVPLTGKECQMLAYYESLKSREDSDHLPKTDPLVGAVVTNKNEVDLQDCICYTTLEPCVDDVRGSKWSSCSSLLSSSAIKAI